MDVQRRLAAPRLRRWFLTGTFVLCASIVFLPARPDPESDLADVANGSEPASLDARLSGGFEYQPGMRRSRGAISARLRVIASRLYLRWLAEGSSQNARAAGA